MKRFRVVKMQSGEFFIDTYQNTASVCMANSSFYAHKQHEHEHLNTLGIQRELVKLSELAALIHHLLSLGYKRDTDYICLH